MKAFASLLCAVVCLLALPAAASAVTYTVDSTGDQPDETLGSNGCKTSVNTCTLRAAIQESNNSTSVTDEIAFAAAFNGQLVDTVTLTNGLLPAITNPVSIKGGRCNPTEAGQAGPCAGLEATGLASGLSVENTNAVTIEGLAITGATTGIRVVNSSESFIARNNWLGEKLDGASGTGANTGIWLDPDSDKATIGGTTAGQGNVFVNNAAEGLDIEGASETDVMGNYFGVKADGATKAANGKDIEITDTVAIAATDNEVGDTVSSGASPCDGPCNVISGATSSGVDLFGNGGNEKPATGPTTIQGNYIGLSAAGTAVVANTEYGVFTGKAGNVTVGGPTNGDANFFAGSGTGIFYSSGEGFKAMGNSFGKGPSGNVTSPNMAMFISTLENSLPVVVSGNTMRMEGGTAIEARFGGTEITNSFIEGAELGILTKVAPGPAGSNLIEKNVIGESTANGIRIEDNANLVFGNTIYKSSAAGIRLQAPAALLHANENQIGGDTTDRENNIRESGGDAIEIDNTGEEESSENEIARNRGEKNAGLFIDLIGPTTNGGIQPPAFATAKQAGASGTGAEPNATIRVFRKKAAEAGELESFLEETVADGSGNWTVTYPASIPGGTIVAATQTNVAGATSELSTATTVADPIKEGGGSGGKDDKKEKEGHKQKPKPPLETTIRSGPKGKVHSTTAKFKFVSNSKGAKFECKLDRKSFKPCKSPKTYRKLRPGKHVFKVRAVKGKNVDPTPAKRKFKVLP